MVTLTVTLSEADIGRRGSKLSHKNSGDNVLAIDLPRLVRRTLGFPADPLPSSALHVPH